MTTIELNNIQSGKVSAVAGQECGQPRARGKDNGPTTLPHLEHLVHITRKVQRPMLLRILCLSCGVFLRRTPVFRVLLWMLCCSSACPAT